ncbi:Cytochrome P450 97B3, chloroplastic [Fusarium oxysporum f. sp. cubense race 1]|uniref:Cytochrome P450 97B3, chloroplastic n=1 Tax=Fusarium oxysporum f. sp. cubense (strain race 1) TaxID=1229664 RepID=N4TKQ6_FUSC1|nr:Cytochrome P450 97B3, chloroplastic [Fusarium oxysporum f. sp. cubense race 1]
MIETWQIILAGATLSGYLLALLHPDNQKIFIRPRFISPLRHIPTPGGNHWLWGHGMKLYREPYCSPVREWNETVPNHGFLRYLGFFNAERIVLTSPEALHEVLEAGRFLGIGLILSEGDAHKLQRRSMNPALAPRNIKALYPLFWNKTREMIERITADRLETVEVVEWASRITLDLIGVAGLGRDFGAIQDGQNEMVKTYNIVFQPSAQARMLHLIESLVPAWVLTALPIKLNSDMSQAARSIRETCRDIISSKQKKQKEKKLDDMDIISAAIRTGTFTEDGLIDQAMTLLAAGKSSLQDLYHN